MSSIPTVSFATTSSLATPSASLWQQFKYAVLGRPGRRGRRFLFSFLLFAVAFAGLVAHYNIDTALTDEDRQYIHLLLPDVAEGSASSMPYEAQIALIQRIQCALLDRVTTKQAVPEGIPREIKQLYLGRKGLCYDRSRSLEKIFTYIGLKFRHIALFTREPNVNPLKTVLFHHVASHAISEVRTARGWMLVDSNDFWLGLDTQKNPVAMHQLVDRFEKQQSTKWLIPVPTFDGNFYSKSCVYVYGLYSRHGRFYPPYTSNIPDYLVRGLLYNFKFLRN